MALTKSQVDSIVDLFSLAFANSSDESVREKAYFEFEDIFGKGIDNWQAICRGKIKQCTLNEAVIEHFDRLAHRHDNKVEDMEYLIREIKESDLAAVIELINNAFSMNLTYFDNDKIKKFMDSGYSFVACNNDEVLGVALGYYIPDLCMDAVYLDTLTVAETIRGRGIGRKLLSHISKCAISNKIYEIKLHTDRTIEAYQIYKHWGFKESKLVLMKAFVL